MSTLVGAARPLRQRTGPSPKAQSVAWNGIPAQAADAHRLVRHDATRPPVYARTGPLGIRHELAPDVVPRDAAPSVCDR